LIDARENVKYFIFFHPLMLFGNLNSVNLPTQIVKVPKMIHASDPLLPKFFSVSKKTNRSSFYSKTVFLFVTAFAISASAVAQSIDYNLAKNWMCHPVLKSTDIARQQNLTLTVRNPDLSIDTVIAYTPYADTLVDIFYVYPTIDMDFSHPGNTAMDSIDTLTAKFVYCGQVGIYAQFGRVFVPYYRQAKISVFLDTTSSVQGQLEKANYMEMAYNDIDSAFNNYLKYYNKGHKIILMGHSQGAYLIRFLLRKRFDNNPSLMSRLVVAISGGEPNYASTSGSRTGGSLQNIKTCHPRDSVPECGCIINWRTWNRDSVVQNLGKYSFFFNKNFVNKGLIYQTYDTINHTHQESNYDFGYSVHKTIARFISIDSGCRNYVGFDNMFRAEVTSVPAVPGSTYLLIDPVNIPNDQRKIDSFPPYLPVYLRSYIPLLATNNYHIWDMQFFQNDLLQILPQMIASCHLSGILEKNDLGKPTLIYPNPSNGNVHISIENQKIKSVRLYNLQGEFVEEFFTSDFSILHLPPGIFMVNIQTDKSIFVDKLVKQ